VFRSGSRLRVTIEAPGGNRPAWTLAALPADGSVVNEVAHSSVHASRVTLPVIPGITPPAALPPCPSLRGQPCRAYVAPAAPTEVRTDTIDATTVRVRWTAPARAGVTGYDITDVITGATATTTGATSVELTVEPGEHAFAVRARFGETRGPASTASSTLLVEAAEDTTTTTAAQPTTTTTDTDTGGTTTTDSTVAGAGGSTTTTAAGGGTGSLPYTGAALGGLAIVGAGAAIGGAALRRAARRRRAVA
jgi:hypothetical protein